MNSPLCTRCLCVELSAVCFQSEITDELEELNWDSEADKMVTGHHPCCFGWSCRSHPVTGLSKRKKKQNKEKHKQSDCFALSLSLFIMRLVSALKNNKHLVCAAPLKNHYGDYYYVSNAFKVEQDAGEEDHGREVIRQSLTINSVQNLSGLICVFTINCCLAAKKGGGD